MLLFALGAATGLFGMATDRLWLVTIGTVFLGAGLLIAIRETRRSREAGAETSGDADDADDDRT
jgi:hypothetical protein